MPSDRFFVEGIHAVGERVALADDDAHKVIVVLRRRSGDRVHVVDSGGTVFGAVLAVDGTRAKAELVSATASETESRARIVIAQAIPKGQKMDLIVEKATELGAAAFVPLRSERVIGERTGEHKHDRWQRIAKTAAQQSGRAVVPVVEPVREWPALLAQFRFFDRVYLPWEVADPVPLRARFEREAPAAQSVLIVIGPEGGFSAGEVERAVAAGAVVISLGRRILRTETAALVVLAALLYARDEL